MPPNQQPLAGFSLGVAMSSPHAELLRRVNNIGDLIESMGHGQTRANLIDLHSLTRDTVHFSTVLQRLVEIYCAEQSIVLDKPFDEGD